MPSLGDTLFAFTEWLRTTQLPEFSLWLSETKLSVWFQTHFWVIPTGQSIHILSIAALFGSAVMLDLRIFGLAGESRSIDQLSRRYVPWIWWSFLVLLITGIVLTIAEPVRELINPVFWVKMGLLPVAVVLNLWFQSAVRKRSATWDSNSSGHAAIQFGAVVLILLWCLIMFCGRWIAYAPV